MEDRTFEIARNLEIAHTIQSQLGNRALFMMGAKNFSVSGAGLSFKIMRNSKSVTHIKITLNAMDTYDIEFTNCNKNRIKEIATENDVYCDQLHEIIEQNTGLYLHL